MSKEQQEEIGAEISVAEDTPEQILDDLPTEESTVEQNRGWLAVAIGALAVVLALCTIVVCASAAILVFSGGEDMSSVTGSVIYRERMALGPDAVVKVEIQDVSRADAAADVIGQKTIRNPGQVPIAFEVAYDKKEIIDNHTYVIRARIEDGTGQLLFTSTERYPVITRGSPTRDVQVTVERFGAAPPEATTQPVEAYIAIDDPVQGATIDIDRPFMVVGRGAGLPEGNVVVEIQDRDGNALIQQPTTLQGPDVGSGGEGTWSLQLSVETEPGVAGKIYAYSRSPLDNSLIAEASVEVSLGRTEAKPIFLEISEPVEGANLDTSGPIQVSGIGGGLPEGNVVVWALDADDTILAQQATTLQGPDVGTGGAGTWSVQLSVGAVPGSVGRIVAFSPSPINNTHVASAVINVTYGQEAGPGLDGSSWVLRPTLPDTEITILFQDGTVSGSSGCNSYTGSYTVSSLGGTNTIQIGPLASTMMMCETAVMEQEMQYAQALQSATSYSVDENMLTLSYPGGTLWFESTPNP